MGCYRCGQGLHFECQAVSGQEKCCGETSLCNEGLQIVESESRSNGDRALKDPESTIRKEAARLYPLDRSAACEWQRLANVGGGKYPIVGCIDGKQETIHHGPEKIPRNGSEVTREDADRLNRQSNVHRICSRCHNLYHAWIDGDYDPEGPFAPHAPREARVEELALWSSSKTRPKPAVARAGSFARKEVAADDL